MKRAFLFVGAAVLAAGSTLTLTASRYEARIRPNTSVGMVPVGGLTPEEAKRKLRIWWESEKHRELSIRLKENDSKGLRSTGPKLGYALDDEASVRELPLEDLWHAVGRVVRRDESPMQRFPIHFKRVQADTSFVAEFVRDALGSHRPARVRLKGGVLVREPEVGGAAVDWAGFADALHLCYLEGKDLVVPLAEAPKRVPDPELDKITDIVVSFNTRFPAHQRSRNANIALASGKIDGTVLMPGDVFSFNDTVGRRTIREGYKLAGVYRNGRHDIDIGGGICQVSGTLYNAALLANLGIRQRQNHSMPVPYLPVGRDATVDYGSVDLRFENTTGSPIAIASTYETGKLTFHVLGKKQPGFEVKLITSGHRSWGRGVKYVTDASLPVGKEKVIEKGSSGHSVFTHRVLFQDGKEVSRELLGKSHYGGGVRIIARNPGTASTRASEPVSRGAGDAADAPLQPPAQQTGGGPDG